MAVVKVAVYTGSFDPLTLGHLDIIARAAKLFDRLIIAIGEARGKSTLFSIDERLTMLRESCEHLSNVETTSFAGLAVDFANQVGASALVRGLRSGADYTYEVTMAQMNRSLRPNLETIFLPTSPALSHISSTLAKEIAGHGGNAELLCPPAIAERLRAKLKVR